MRPVPTLEALAASLPPEELNRVGFRLYERFRPDVPEGARGGGRRGSCWLSGLSGRRGDGLPVRSLSRYCCNGANRRYRPRRGRQTADQVVSEPGV